MKITKIEYSKTMSCDFNNARVSATIDLDDGDSEVEAMSRIKAWVNRQVESEIIPEWKIAEAKRIVSASQECTPENLKRAQETLNALSFGDLPF